MGMLTTNNVHLEEHEYATVKLLLENGFNIELVPPSKIKGLRMPDLMINSVPWEMKAPQGDGKRTIMNTIQNAAHQSGNVVIDPRRCKLSEDQAINEIKHHFSLSKRIRRMKIVTKSEKIIDLDK